MCCLCLFCTRATQYLTICNLSRSQIWLLNDAQRGFSEVPSLTWNEDTRWLQRLDEGWDLAAVRDIGRACIRRFSNASSSSSSSSVYDGDGGGCSKVSWLDDGSEHQHRIALSVHASVVEGVVEFLKDGIKSRSVLVSW